MTNTMIRFRQVVLDTTDARRLAEFYRHLLGFVYRPGDETADPAGDDWLVLRNPDGGPSIAFQRVDQLPEATWPDGRYPQMLHLDLTVTSAELLTAEHARVLALGGRLLEDRLDDPDEPLYVYADPAGHPFCIFVAPEGSALATANEHYCVSVVAVSLSQSETRPGPPVGHAEEAT